MSDRIVIGIDVAKDTLEVAFGPTGHIQSIASETSGHDMLIARLSEQPVELIVMEATGGYELGKL